MVWWWASSVQELRPEVGDRSGPRADGLSWASRRQGLILLNLGLVLLLRYNAICLTLQSNTTPS